MKTYLKSLASTLIILIVAFIVATISDINDLFDLKIISLLILVPSIIISALFFGLYRKIHLWSIVSLLVGIAYFYLLMKISIGVDPFGILIYSGFIYLPLIILGSIFSFFWRASKIKRGTYI